MPILKKINDSIWKIKIAFWWQIAGFFIKPKQADLKNLITSDQIKNILIAELNHIGDKLLITPAIRALKQQYPQVKITVLANSKLTASVLAKNPYIDQLEIAAPYFGLFMYCLKNRGKFDLLIDFSANLYFAFLLTLAKIPCRIGTKPKQKILFKPRNGFGWIYTHTKDFSSQTYIADYFLSLLQFLGITNTDNRLEIYLEEAEKQKALNLLAQHNLSANGFIFLHPGVLDIGKTWDISYWQKLAQELIKSHKIIFSGSQQDQKVVTEICQGLNPDQAINLGGKLSVREDAAVISMAQALIGLDTGSLHLAVALNKPIVAIFNTTHPQNYLPARENIAVLSTPETCKQNFTLDYIKTQHNYTHLECLKIIKPEQVFAAVEKLLK